LGETLFKPGTQEPRTQDELGPLDIATEDMDLLFYSYRNIEGETREFTLLDYKIHFDKMSVFQRPKDTDMLGGLRNKIEGELGKIVLNFEAEDSGLFEDPEVVAKVDLKVEEMIVNKLYAEVIQIEERVTSKEMDEFWAEHSHEYVARENRSGRLVICQDAQQADEAHAAASGGMEWKDLLVAFGVDRENKSRSGKLLGVMEKSADPISVVLFSIQLDELSEPFALGDGRYGIVRLDFVKPEKAMEMTEVTEAVGQRMREIRKEEVFQAKMAKWREDIPIAVIEENLANVASWKELTTVEIPENVVPRN
jgi:hypothetical protein